jgi:phospholipid transport system substrate-binding protein
MKMPKRQWYCVLGLVCLSFFVAAKPTDPYQLLESVANKTFTQIKSDQTKIQQNPNTLRDIIKQELMPHVYYKYSALKVLSKNYKSVPKEKVPEYIEVFRDYLVTSLAVALSYYTDQEVVFEPARAVGDDKDISIKALIKDPGQPDINLAFRLRIDPEIDDWKVYDIVAEGISLLSSKESEFAPILRTSGIQAVIDSMKSTNDSPIQLSQSK